MKTRINLHQKKNNEQKVVIFSAAVSLLFHLILLAALSITPKFKSDTIILPSVINVSMIALPEPVNEKSPEPVKTEPLKSEPVKKIKKKLIPKIPNNKVQIKPAAEQVKKEISFTVNKKKKIKKSLKKKTYQASKVHKNAMAQISKKVDESKADQLARAFNRLKSKVKETEASESTSNRQSAPSGGKQTFQILDLYRVEVAYHIKKNWAFSKQMAGGNTSSLSVELAFKVLPGGEIVDIWFDKRSGNTYLDDSARKAVMKSNPVLPHPEKMGRPFVIIGLRFTDKGLE
ncbi:MAG TPA: hypothetical protein DD405_01710 [Desulfobacteraceae bacterium]|nr:hypothetical protein [Desulfobacteraceae bacterium]